MMSVPSRSMKSARFMFYGLFDAKIAIFLLSGTIEREEMKKY